ncbi:uncharacterized protein LOC144429506 isoform X2 [Styela clava]
MKELPVINKILFWILLFCCGTNYSEAAQCTDCQNTILGTVSKKITYGPSDQYNCWCEWIIPTSVDTDHETAVVLLLQNYLLPMSTASGSRDCSGEIKFPSTDGYKCDFPSNYCLAFATASTICNISKIRADIPVANHTCNSIIPWNRAGGIPYKIRYNAKNSAGDTKYFTIQYFVVDCRPSTSTTEANIYNEATVGSSVINNKNNTDGISTSRISSTSANQEQILTPTTIIIIASSASGVLIMLISALLIKRYCHSDNTRIMKAKEQETGLEERSEREIVENAIYETSPNDQQGPETIINEIYNITPDTKDETTKTDELCLYAVVQKKEKTEDKIVVTEGNDDIVTIEDEPSSIYAVVNKDKK